MVIIIACAFCVRVFLPTCAHNILTNKISDVKWPAELLQRSVALDDVIEANLMSHLEYCIKFIDFALKKGKVSID